MRANARLRSIKFLFAAALLVLLVIALARGAAAEEKPCDPGRECQRRWTCFDGLIYPTTCGPANCDKPITPVIECEPESECRKRIAKVENAFSRLAFWKAMQCKDRACIDRVMRRSARERRERRGGCGQAWWCIGGLLYPSTCGPANCEQPRGRCDKLYGSGHIPEPEQHDRRQRYEREMRERYERRRRSR